MIVDELIKNGLNCKTRRYTKYRNRQAEMHEE